MGRADLHIHTTASDGTDAPAEVVRKAKDAGLTYIAITDHNTVDGIAEALETGKSLGIEVLPGIELSTDYDGQDVHMLGYLSDPYSPVLKPELEAVITRKEERNRAILEKLTAGGYPMPTYDELKAAHPGAVIGRPHIARAMVERGYASDVTSAIRGFLVEGREFFVPYRYIPFRDAAQLLLSAGAVPVLAHPLQYRFDEEHLEKLISDAAEAGVMGIETNYSGYSQIEICHLQKLGTRRRLLFTGGSDYHGSNKPSIQIGTGTGDLNVPDFVAKNLKNAVFSAGFRHRR